MASKIDKINVNGTSYDIDLPSTATPSITGLTVTGNLTVSGTSDLADINCTGLTCSGQVTSTSVDTETLTANNVDIKDTLQVRKGIVGGNSGGAVCFLADSSSLNGGLFFTPLSNTTTNRTWALDNSGSDLLLGINGSVEAIGDLTVSGTSDLNIVNCAVVNCAAITCSEGQGTFSHVTTSTLAANSATLRENLTTAHLSIRDDSLTGIGIDCSDASIICPTLKANSDAGNLTVPTTSGTLALTSDLPVKTTLTLSGTTVSNSHILNIVLPVGTSFSASAWLAFSPTSSFINTYSAQLDKKLFKCVLSSLYYQDDQLKGTMEASGLIYFSKLPVGDGTNGTFYG